MVKYDNVLHMGSDNSASLILQNINPNTMVLELGSGNGYMTQYLKETLHCDAYIVEIDLENGIEASKYAVQYLIGSDLGNIEKYDWLEKWKHQKFDYIIFADVLEHLYNPYEVLKNSIKLLNHSGSILISIPNISHNSIIIDLINDNFEYRELGLLDNTHIRFFTRKTLSKMVSDNGLCVVKEMNTHCAVEHTELKNSFYDVSSAIEEELKSRKDGDTYQFVWELKII